MHRFFAVLLFALSSTASAGPLDGSFTLPTQYEDGTALPQASIKHIRVEVGTCLAGPAFGAVEGTQLVVPPATTWAITVPRAFGKFCVRAQTETVSGLTSVWTGVATKTIVEPNPKPPVMLTTGGGAWEMKLNGDLKFVGTVKPGSPCLGLSARIEPDFFAVDRADVRWERGAGPRTTIVAQCEAVQSS